MKLISHRGNINGKDEKLENEPTYIDLAIKKGYDVEVDVWYKDGMLWLGHDKPDYSVDFRWFIDRITKLWIHCKNVDAVVYFKNCGYHINYFWHENDTLTITSNGDLWVFPGKQPIENSIAVMPEIHNDDITNAKGICSDFVETYSNYRLKVTHNAGFFSCSTIRLMDIINFHHKNNILPVIVDSSEQWVSYKDDPSSDISGEFFNNKFIIGDLTPETMIYSQNENQFSDYSLINFNYVNKLIDKYFSPADDVVDIKNRLINKYGIDVTNTIAICYRGNDKSRETIIPTYDEMVEKIRKVTDENVGCSILLQTDEIEFQEIIKKTFKNVITIDETKKINKSNTAIQYTIPVGERLLNAKNFLAVMLIMSDTYKIILNSGNVGMWICLFRGHTEGIYQYLNHNNNINKWLK